MSSYNKLSQLQYNLCKEASNIPSPSLHLSGILLKRGFETERNDLYPLSRCFYCYFQRKMQIMGSIIVRVISAMFFYLYHVGRQWSPMITYSVTFGRVIMQVHTFIPHVFLPVATYHKMIKSYQNVFCWFDSTIMLQHCTFGLYSVEIASKWAL